MMYLVLPFICMIDLNWLTKSKLLYSDVKILNLSMYPWLRTKDVSKKPGPDIRSLFFNQPYPLLVS